MYWVDNKLWYEVGKTRRNYWFMAHLINEVKAIKLQTKESVIALFITWYVFDMLLFIWIVSFMHSGVKYK